MVQQQPWVLSAVARRSLQTSQNALQLKFSSKSTSSSCEPDYDELMFRAKDRKNRDRKTWTLRKFLSFVSSFYDPLGIISPFLIQAKILLQELWKHGREWNEAISGNNGRVIKDWVEETELLGTVGVNRLVGGTGLEDTMELHVFCDLSLEATAPVAYIKTTSNQGTTTRAKQEWHPYVKKKFPD